MGSRTTTEGDARNQPMQRDMARLPSDRSCGVPDAQQRKARSAITEDRPRPELYVPTGRRGDVWMQGHGVYKTAREHHPTLLAARLCGVSADRFNKAPWELGPLGSYRQNCSSRERRRADGDQGDELPGHMLLFGTSRSYRELRSAITSSARIERSLRRALGLVRVRQFTRP